MGHDAATYDVLIVGAGQSGLAMGQALLGTGVRVLIVDAHAAVGGSWPYTYDSLVLFSPARYSQLPGLPFPGHPDATPTRDAMAAYLRAYARHFDLPIALGTRIVEVCRAADGLFHASAADGRVFVALAVVAASGPFTTPHIPRLAGADVFQGQALHVHDYRRPAPFAGQHVVVVGAGESALQVAIELAGVARVSVVARRRPVFLPTRILGRSLFWWLHDTGFDRVPLGLWTDITAGSKVIIDVPRLGYRRAIARGNPRVRAPFVRLTRHGVLWADGTHDPVDTLLYATGYREHLPYLAGLPGALGADGKVRQRGGVLHDVPGVFTVGLYGQRAASSATVRGAGADARFVRRRLLRFLGEKPTSPPWPPAPTGVGGVKLGG